MALFTHKKADNRKIEKAPTKSAQDTPSKGQRKAPDKSSGSSSVQSTKKTNKVKLKSTQMFSPIRDIKDGIIITKDGRFCKVLEFSPINFILLPENERTQIADAFGAALKVFPRNFQIIILSRKANVESHVHDLEVCIANENNENCRRMQKDAIETIRKTATSSTSRRFLVAFDYTPPPGLRSPSFDSIRDDLWQTSQLIANCLGSQPCNNALLSEIDKCDPIMDILYEILCRKEAEQKTYATKMADVIGVSIAENGYDPAAKNQTLPANNLYCPRWIKPSNYRYLDIDGKCYITGYIHQNSYPTACLPGWLTPIINLGEGIDIIIYATKQDTKTVQSKLTYSMQLSQSASMHKSASSADLAHLQTKMKSENYIRRGLSSDETLMYFSTQINVSADSPREVQAKFKLVSDKLANMGLDLRPLNGNHDLAFKSSLPLCNPDKCVTRYAQRNILTGDFGAAYPFTSYEINDPGGILLGKSRRNNAPVFISLFDRRLYNNGNITIFGASGSGKSFSMMCTALHLREHGTQIIIIAPYKGSEFIRSCKAIGGIFITIAPGSPQNINIMEIRKYDSATDDMMSGGESDEDTKVSILAAKLGQLRTFFSMIHPSMTGTEWQILDKALIQTYRNYGISDKNSSLIDPQNPNRYKAMPILGDLDRELAKSRGSAAIRSSLSRFVSGSAKSFNAPTNVDLESDYIVIDVSQMPKDLIPLGIFIAADYVYDTIRANIFQSKAIFMDELSKLIGIGSSPEAAEFVMKLYKTVRSYNTIVVGATQDLNDFFALSDGWYGRGILANAQIKLLMKAEEGEVPTLERQLRLSPEEATSLLYMERGSGLLIAGRNHTEISITASPLEHAYITTDPEELERLFRERSL